MSTYYVDATGGSDSNDGLSEANAWKTISKVNSSSFNPGDSILFKRGEVWREQLTIPSSGSSGNPITFGAYGSGDNPLILGSDDYDDTSKWSRYDSQNVIHEAYFENNDLSEWDSSQTTGGTVATSSTQAHIGSYSLEINNTGGGSTSVLEGNAFNNKTEIYLRFCINFDTTSFVNYDQNSIIEALDDSGTYQFRLFMYKTSTNYYLWIRLNGDGDPVDIPGKQSNGWNCSSIMDGAWHEIKIRYKVASGAGADDGIGQFWVDGTSRGSNVAVDNDTRNGVGQYYLGLRSTDASTTATWYFDDIVMSTSDIQGIIWKTANSSFTSTVNMLWYDTASTPSFGTQVSNYTDLDANWKFWYDSTNDMVVLYHSGGNPADQTNGLEIGKRIICIGSGQNRNYITIDGIDVKFANYDGIRFLDTPIDITIKNLNVTYNGSSGIYTEYASDIQINNITANYNYYGVFLKWTSSGRIQNCIIENNTDHGICITQAHNLTIQNNSVGHNGRSGIGGDQFYSCIIQDNHIYDNDVGGIDLTGTSVACHDNIVRRNIFYDHQGQTWSGAVHMWADDTSGYETYNNKVYYNIFYNNKDAIHIDGRSHDNEIYNNIIYNCVKGINILSTNTAVPTNNIIKNNIVSNSTENLIRDETGESTNTLDYNCYYPNGDDLFRWDNTYYDTFSAYQTASGQDSHSINSDPLFVDAANGDFRLQSGSPCINAGTDVGLTQDYEGNSVPQGSNPDIGAYEKIVTKYNSLFFGQNF